MQVDIRRKPDIRFFIRGFLDRTLMKECINEIIYSALWIFIC